jgi:thioredoxin 1
VNGDADVSEARRGLGHANMNLTTGREGANGMTETHPVAVTDATFGAEVEQQKGLVVVDFWATWCGPCHMVAPILEQLAGEYGGRMKVAKMDVDANQQTPMRFNVRSIPSILFFRDGRHIDTLVGAYPKAAFDEKIQQHLK